MLKLSRQQIAELDREVMAACVRDLSRYLRAEHPAAVGGIDDAELRRRVEKGIARAMGYGMTWDASVTAFVAIMFEVAPTFDEQPAIQRVLRDRRLPADVRVDALWDQTTDEDWDEAERMATRAEAFWSEGRDDMGKAKARAKGAAKKAGKKRGKSKLGGTCPTCKSCAALREAMRQKQGVAKEKLTPEQAKSLQEFKDHWAANKDHYEQLAQSTNRPAELLAAINFRESTTPGQFNTYLHNGQPLGKPTTIAPKGKDFKKGEFDEAAKDAMKDHDYCAKSMKMSKDTKDRAAMDAYAETYNGRGPGAGSYVWSGTDQAPATRYVSDGVLGTSPDAKPGVDTLLQGIGVGSD